MEWVASLVIALYIFWLLYCAIHLSFKLIHYAETDFEDLSILDKIVAATVISAIILAFFFIFIPIVIAIKTRIFG